MVNLLPQQAKMITTIEIKGPGGTINYPTGVIVKALKEAGLQVEIQDDYPSNNIEEILSENKKMIEDGRIKDWKINVKATHLPWGG